VVSNWNEPGLYVGCGGRRSGRQHDAELTQTVVRASHDEGV
jgi:hypothetical protein